MRDRVSESELTFLELDAKYHLDKPTDREALLKVIAEVREWRRKARAPFESYR